MPYIPNKTVYTDTIKTLTDKTNADMDGVKAELDSRDAIINNLASAQNTHLAETTSHGATSLPTPNRMIVRDADGRAKVVDPLFTNDIATKGYVDAITISAINHINSSSSVHGSTSAATPGAIIQRDANGRAKVAVPLASDDIARKDTVDGVNATIMAHINSIAPHGATASAIANTMMIRDSGGRVKIATPVASDDASTKGYVDVVQSNLAAHMLSASAHGATQFALADSFMKRDPQGRSQVAYPSALNDIANRAYVDDRVATSAPNGFGLGTIATTAFTNWNNYAASGFYYGVGMTNQPMGISSTGWFVIATSYVSTYAHQLAFNADGSSVYSRSCIGGGWGSWKQIARTGDFVAGTLNLSVGRLRLPVGDNMYATQ